MLGSHRRAADGETLMQVTVLQDSTLRQVLVDFATKTLADPLMALMIGTPVGTCGQDCAGR